MRTCDWYALEIFRIYEEMHPLKIECVSLREQRDSLSAEIAQVSHKLHSTEQNLVQVSLP